MGLFDSKEERERKKREKEEQANVELIKQEKAELENTTGKYVVKSFGSQTWSNSDSMALEKIYKRLVDYANRHDLEIVNVSKVEEGSTVGVQVSAIFKR